MLEFEFWDLFRKEVRLPPHVWTVVLGGRGTAKCFMLVGAVSGSFRNVD